DFDDDKKKQSHGTESILNALILALDDRLQGRPEPSEHTHKALSILWSTQIKDGPHKGSWEWLNFGTEPWESKESRYMGATPAAIAIGAAPGYASGAGARDAQAQQSSLRRYLTDNFASQNLHNRVWILWASVQFDGLLTPAQKDALITQMLQKQQPGGGWS